MHIGASKSLYSRNRRRHLITYPQYLCIDAGTLQEDFETIGDWTSTAGNAPAADAVNYKIGSKSIQVDTTGQATNTFHKTVSWDLSSVQDDAMEIWIRWTSDDPINPQNFMYLTLSADSGFTKYFRATINLSYPQYSSAEYYKTDTPWRLIRLGKSDWIANGGMTWSDTVIRFQILCSMASARNHVYNFDAFKVGVKYYPAVLLVHDDGEGTSFYENGTHEFAIRGLRYTFSARGDTTDTAGRTSSAQLRDMQYRHRALIVSHSWDHDWYTDSQASIETDMQQVEDLLTLAGVGKYGLDYIIYPGGEYTANIKAALLAKGSKSGRGVYGAYDSAAPLNMATDGGYYSLSALANPCQNIYYVNSRSLEVDVTTNAVIAEINKAIAKKCIYSAYYHQILPEDSAITPDYYWNAYRLGKILDHCMINRIPLLTYHDFYMLTQGPWPVEVPW